MWGGTKGIPRFWAGCALSGDLDLGTDRSCKLSLSELRLLLSRPCILSKILLFVTGSLSELEEADVGDCRLLWSDFDSIFSAFSSSLSVSPASFLLSFAFLCFALLSQRSGVMRICWSDEPSVSDFVSVVGEICCKCSCVSLQNIFILYWFKHFELQNCSCVSPSWKST